MNMKKKALIVVMAAGLTFTGLQHASAKGWGGGQGRGYGMGYEMDCPCGGYGPNMQLDDATREKIQAFRADTVELRKQIAMKRAEKRALMSSENPDPAAVAQVVGELFDLRQTMQAKAQEAGVPMMRAQRGFKGAGGKGGYGGSGRPCGNQPTWN